MERDWRKKGLAEMLGGFGLVTVGAGSVLAASLTGQNVILFAAFGHALVIAVLGTVLGPISGGQISPAVSLGLIVTRRQKVDIGIVIIAFQLIGSIIGGFFLLWLYPISPNSVGAVNHLATPALKSVPSFTIDPLKGVVVEGLMTFLLVFVVFATAIDSRGTAKTLGAFPIGFAVGIDWLFGGALTG